MLNFIKDNFIMLDAEVALLELLSFIRERTTGDDHDYMYYIGIAYAVIRLGWYLYTRIHELKKNEIDRENSQLEKSINEQKLKSWKILNDENFKSSLSQEGLEEIKELYKEKGFGDKSS